MPLLLTVISPLTVLCQMSLRIHLGAIFDIPAIGILEGSLDKVSQEAFVHLKSGLLKKAFADNSVQLCGPSFKIQSISSINPGAGDKHYNWFMLFRLAATQGILQPGISWAKQSWFRDA